MGVGLEGRDIIPLVQCRRKDCGMVFICNDKMTSDCRGDGGERRRERKRGRRRGKLEWTEAQVRGSVDECNDVSAGEQNWSTLGLRHFSIRPRLFRAEPQAELCAL